MRRSLITLLLAHVALSGCRMVGTPVPAGPAPSTAEEQPNPSRQDAELSARERSAHGVVDSALGAMGTPYRWGGTAANGFDCSGLIQYAYGQYGIELPRRGVDQLQMGRPLTLATGSFQPADLLGFSEEAGGKSTHVGLYLGDGEFIHSSTSGVRVSSLGNPYWQVRLMAARRILDDARSR